PGFVAGLVVHPMNPKAWAMITASFTFVPTGMGDAEATAWVAGLLLACQLVLQPLWGVLGGVIAKTIQGTRAERGLFITLAVLTVLSVVYAIWGLNR
ncbi:MAG: LysE family translocator, partial [Pseudomonadota bacterium]